MYLNSLLLLGWQCYLDKLSTLSGIKSWDVTLTFQKVFPFAMKKRSVGITCFSMVATPNNLQAFAIQSVAIGWSDVLNTAYFEILILSKFFLSTFPVLLQFIIFGGRERNSRNIPAR